MARLRAAADQVAAGHHRFVVLEGHAGSGKSEVLWAALEGVLHWPRKFASLEPGDRFVPGSAACKLVPGMTPELTSNVPRAVAFALSVLDTFDAPTIIILENAQWTDPVSTEIMSGILPNLGTYPVLFIGTVRPCVDEPAKQLIRAALAPATSSYIDLPPLDPGEARAALTEMIGAPVAPALAGRLHELTGGLPLLLAEAARVLRHRRHDAEAVADALGAFAARTSRRVRDFDATVADTLTFLTPTGRAVLRVLALSPDPLSVAQLEHACGVNELGTADLAPLQDADLIRWEPGERGYRVSLPPIAQGVRQTMLPDEIAATHRALGEISDVSSAPLHRFLGRHPEALGGRKLAEGPNGRVPADVAEHVLRLLDGREHGRVVEYLDALARACPGDDTLGLALLARWREPREDLRGPIRFAMRGARCPLLLSVARAVQHFSEAHYEAAVAELTHAGTVDVDSPVATFVFLQAVDRVARTDAVRGTLFQSRELRRVAATHLQRLERGASGTDDGGAALAAFARPSRLDALHASFALWDELAELVPEPGHVRPGGFAELARRQAAHLEALPDAEDDVLAVRVFAAARARDYSDRPSVVRILGHRSVVEAGTEELVTDAYCQLALTYFDAGQFSRAEEFATLGRAQAFGTYNSELLLTAEAVGVLVAGAREGQDGVAPLLAELQSTPDALWLPFVHLASVYARAWAATADGDHDDVVAALLPVSDNVLGWQPLGMAALTLLARAQYYSGSAALAGEALELIEAYGITATEPVVSFVTAYVRALAAADDDPRRAAAEYSAALAAAARIPDVATGAPDARGGGLRVYRALAAYDYGRLVVESGGALRGHALEAFRAALGAQQLWIGCGASSLREASAAVVRGLRELLDGEGGEAAGGADDDGARPAASSRSQSVATGAALAGLTRREREIAGLIGLGLMNKEIADRLVISVRTAEYHAANVARKLRLGSRSEVRDMFAENGRSPGER
ncbi:hypothetical protein BJH93_09575 [Kocuria polaris]|nr:hypothetical protein [Kocuria polaris]